ncbi:unnamed protein product [Amoebophrya sp. A25]|nr:unnamed protein product [Amoebophrya sp. A25]|eukprot:GSA25T00003132001.1
MSIAQQGSLKDMPVPPPGGPGMPPPVKPSKAVSFGADRQGTKPVPDGLGVLNADGTLSMEALENRLGQIDNEDEHMDNFKKIVSAQKETIDGLKVNIDEDRLKKRTRQQQRLELLKEYGQADLEESMAPQVITDPDDPLWKPKLSAWQRQDILQQRKMRKKKEDQGRIDTIGRARFLAVLNEAKEEMSRAMPGEAGAEGRPKGQATVREMLTAARTRQTPDTYQAVLHQAEREMDPTRMTIDASGIDLDRKVVIPRDSVQRAANAHRSKQQENAPFEMGEKELDKVAKRALAPGQKKRGKRMVKKAPPPPPPEDANNPEDVDPKWGRVITNADGTTIVMKVKHERLSCFRLSKLEERMMEERERFYLTHLIRGVSKMSRRFDDLMSLVGRRLMGKRLPASSGAADGLDMLGDCQGSADWEDDARDEARIVAALNRIAKSTKLREAPRTIGLVPYLKPFHREEAHFLKEGRGARERERSAARIRDDRRSKGFETPSTSESDDGSQAAESEMAEFETRLEARITQIRGVIVGARNLYKDIVVGDGISMAPRIGDVNREVPVPDGMTWQRAEKLARSADARAKRRGSVFTSATARVFNGMDPFEREYNPNPYVVIKGIDADTTIFELCRTEPLLETKAPCWDLDFNVTIPEHLSKIRGIEFHVYDYNDWLTAPEPLGLMPWDKGDYSLGKWVVDLHSLSNNLTQSDAELRGMKHMNEHKGRLIFQAAMVRRKIHCLKHRLNVETEYEYLRQRITGLYGIQNLYQMCLPERKLPKSIVELGFVEAPTREAVEDTILECHGEKSKRRPFDKMGDDEQEAAAQPPQLEIPTDIQPPPGAPKRHRAVIRRDKIIAEALEKRRLQLEEEYQQRLAAYQAYLAEVERMRLQEEASEQERLRKEKEDRRRRLGLDGGQDDTLMSTLEEEGTVLDDVTALSGTKLSASHGDAIGASTVSSLLVPPRVPQRVHQSSEGGESEGSPLSRVESPQSGERPLQDAGPPSPKKLDEEEMPGMNSKTKGKSMAAASGNRSREPSTESGGGAGSSIDLKNLVREGSHEAEDPAVAVDPKTTASGAPAEQAGGAAATTSASAGDATKQVAEHDVDQVSLDSRGLPKMQKAPTGGIGLVGFRHISNIVNERGGGGHKADEEKLAAANACFALIETKQKERENAKKGIIVEEDPENQEGEGGTAVGTAAGGASPGGGSPREQSLNATFRTNATMMKTISQSELHAGGPSRNTGTAGGERSLFSLGHTLSSAALMSSKHGTTGNRGLQPSQSKSFLAQQSRTLSSAGVVESDAGKIKGMSSSSSSSGQKGSSSSGNKDSDESDKRSLLSSIASSFTKKKVEEKKSDDLPGLKESLQLDALTSRIHRERRQAKKRIYGDTSLPAFTVVVFGVFSNGEERELHRFPLVTSYNTFGMCPVDMLVGDSTLLGPNGATSNKIKYALRLPTTRPPPTEIEMDLVNTLKEIRAKRQPNSPANKIFADQLNRCKPVVGVKGFEPLDSGMKNVTQGRSLGGIYGFHPLAESFVISVPGLKGGNDEEFKKKFEEAQQRMLQANTTRMDKEKSSLKKDPRQEARDAVAAAASSENDGGSPAESSRAEKEARKRKRIRVKERLRAQAAKEAGENSPGGFSKDFSEAPTSPSNKSQSGEDENEEKEGDKSEGGEQLGATISATGEVIFSGDKSKDADEDEDYKTLLFSDHGLSTKVEKALNKVDEDLHSFVNPRWTYDFNRDNPFARQNSTLLAERTYARKNQMGEGMVEGLLNEPTTDLLYLRFRVFEPSTELMEQMPLVTAAAERRKDRRKRELDTFPLFPEHMPYDLQKRAVENKSVYMHFRGGHKRLDGLFAKEEMMALVAERKRLQEEAEARDWKAQLRMNQVKAKHSSSVSKAAGRWMRRAENAGGLQDRKKKLEEEAERLRDEEEEDEEDTLVGNRHDEGDEDLSDSALDVGLEDIGGRSREVSRMLRRAEEARRKAEGQKKSNEEALLNQRKGPPQKQQAGRSDEEEDAYWSVEMSKRLAEGSPKNNIGSAPTLRIDAQMALDAAEFSSSAADTESVMSGDSSITGGRGGAPAKAFPGLSTIKEGRHKSSEEVEVGGELVDVKAVMEEEEEAAIDQGDDITASSSRCPSKSNTSPDTSPSKNDPSTTSATTIKAPAVSTGRFGLASKVGSFLKKHVVKPVKKKIVQHQENVRTGTEVSSSTTTSSGKRQPLKMFYSEEALRRFPGLRVDITRGSKQPDTSSSARVEEGSENKTAKHASVACHEDAEEASDTDPEQVHIDHHPSFASATRISPPPLAEPQHTFSSSEADDVWSLKSGSSARGEAAPTEFLHEILSDLISESSTRSPLKGHEEEEIVLLESEHRRPYIWSRKTEDFAPIDLVEEPGTSGIGRAVGSSGSSSFSSCPNMMSNAKSQPSMFSLKIDGGAGTCSVGSSSNTTGTNLRHMTLEEKELLNNRRSRGSSMMSNMQIGGSSGSTGPMKRPRISIFDDPEDDEKKDPRREISGFSATRTSDWRASRAAYRKRIKYLPPPRKNKMGPIQEEGASDLEWTPPVSPKRRRRTSGSGTQGDDTRSRRTAHRRSTSSSADAPVQSSGGTSRQVLMETPPLRKKSTPLVAPHRQEVEQEPVREGLHSMAEEDSADQKKLKDKTKMENPDDNLAPLKVFGPPPFVTDGDVPMGGRDDKRLVHGGRTKMQDEYEHDEDMDHEPFPAGSMVRVPHTPMPQPDRHLPEEVLQARKLLLPQISEDTREIERDKLLNWQRQRYEYRTKTGTAVSLQIPEDLVTEGFAAEDWRKKSARLYGPPEQDNDRDGEKAFRDLIEQEDREKSEMLNSVWGAYRATDSSDDDAEIMDAFRVEGVGQLLAEGVYFLNSASLHEPATIEVALFPSQAVAESIERESMRALGGAAGEGTTTTTTATGATNYTNAGTGGSGRDNKSTNSNAANLSKKKRIALARARSVAFGGQRSIARMTLKQKIRRVVKFPIDYGREARERDAGLAKARTRREIARIEQVFGTTLPGEGALRAFQEKMQAKTKSFEGRSDATGKKKEMFPVRWSMATMKSTRMLLFFQLEIAGRRYLQEEDITRYVRSRDFARKVEQTNRLRRMAKLKESGPSAPKTNEDEENQLEAANAAEGAMDTTKAAKGEDEELGPEVEYRPVTEITQVYGMIVKCSNVATDARGIMDTAECEEFYRAQQGQLLQSTRRNGKPYDPEKLESEVLAKLKNRSSLWTGVGDSLFRKHRSMFRRTRKTTKVSSTGAETVREHPVMPPMTKKMQCAHLYIVATVLDEQNRPWRKSVVTRVNGSCSANGLGQMPFFNSDFMFAFGGEERGEFGVPEKLEFSLYQKADMRLTEEEIAEQHRRRMDKIEIEKDDFLLQGAGESTEIGDQESPREDPLQDTSQMMQEGGHSSPRGGGTRHHRSRSKILERAAGQDGSRMEYRGGAEGQQRSRPESKRSSSSSSAASGAFLPVSAVNSRTVSKDLSNASRAANMRSNFSYGSFNRWGGGNSSQNSLYHQHDSYNQRTGERDVNSMRGASRVVETNSLIGPHSLAAQNTVKLANFPGGGEGRRVRGDVQYQPPQGGSSGKDQATSSGKAALNASEAAADELAERKLGGLRKTHRTRNEERLAQYGRLGKKVRLPKRPRDRKKFWGSKYGSRVLSEAGSLNRSRGFASAEDYYVEDDSTVFGSILGNRRGGEKRSRLMNSSRDFGSSTGAFSGILPTSHNTSKMLYTQPSRDFSNYQQDVSKVFLAAEQRSVGDHYSTVGSEAVPMLRGDDGDDTWEESIVSGSEQIGGSASSSADAAEARDRKSEWYFPGKKNQTERGPFAAGGGGVEDEHGRGARANERRGPPRFHHSRAESQSSSSPSKQRGEAIPKSLEDRLREASEAMNSYDDTVSDALGYTMENVDYEVDNDSVPGGVKSSSKRKDRKVQNFTERAKYSLSMDDDDDELGDDELEQLEAYLRNREQESGSDAELILPASAADASLDGAKSLTRGARIPPYVSGDTDEDAVSEGSSLGANANTRSSAPEWSTSRSLEAGDSRSVAGVPRKHTTRANLVLNNRATRDRRNDNQTPQDHLTAAQQQQRSERRQRNEHMNSSFHNSRGFQQQKQLPDVDEDGPSLFEEEQGSFHHAFNQGEPSVLQQPSTLHGTVHESSFQGSNKENTEMFEEDQLLPGSQSLEIMQEWEQVKTVGSSWLKMPKFLKNLHFRKKGSAKSKLVQMSSKQQAERRLMERHHNARFERKVGEALREGKAISAVVNTTATAPNGNGGGLVDGYNINPLDSSTAEGEQNRGVSREGTSSRPGTGDIPDSYQDFRSGFGKAQINVFNNPSFQQSKKSSGLLGSVDTSGLPLGLQPVDPFGTTSSSQGSTMSRVPTKYLVPPPMQSRRVAGQDSANTTGGSSANLNARGGGNGVVHRQAQELRRMTSAIIDSPQKSEKNPFQSRRAELRKRRQKARGKILVEGEHLAAAPPPKRRKRRVRFEDEVGNSEEIESDYQDADARCEALEDGEEEEQEDVVVSSMLTSTSSTKKKKKVRPDFRSRTLSYFHLRSLRSYRMVTPSTVKEPARRRLPKNLNVKFAEDRLLHPGGTRTTPPRASSPKSRNNKRVLEGSHFYESPDKIAYCSSEGEHAAAPKAAEKKKARQGAGMTMAVNGVEQLDDDLKALLGNEDSSN